MIDHLAALATDVSFTPDALIIDLPRKTDARALILRLENHFALWAKLMGKKVIIIRSQLGEIKIPASLAVPFTDIVGSQKEFMNSVQFPGLYLGQEIKIYSRDFLRILLNLFERKQSNAGLVRLSDNVQIVLTHGSALSLGVVDASPYTRLRRENYWQPQDLADFNRQWRQLLREDGTNSLEFSYRSLDDPIKDQRDRLNWVRCTSKYRLLKDGNLLYHLVECLDFAPVKRPNVVRA